MSRLVRHLVYAATAVTMLSASAAAQLVGGVGLPTVGLPTAAGNLPVGNVPVAGPVLENLLGQPGAQQAISPTLDTVSGISQTIVDSGAPNLLEIRRLRLDELIRTNRATVESDGTGLPVRRGIVALLDPDPDGLQRALAAGFRIAGDDRVSALGMRAVSLVVPNGISARDGLRLLRKIAPELQADFDHLFEPAGGSLASIAGTLAASSSAAGAGPVIGMIDG